MSTSIVSTAALVGAEGRLVTIHAHQDPSLSGMVITGFADEDTGELRDRVRAAVVNSGCRWPQQRTHVRLLPQDLPKTGSSMDLAVACAVLAAAGQMPPAGVRGAAVIGELGLDGSVRPVRGVLPMVLAAARAGITKVVVPLANATEAALVRQVTVQATDSLRRLVAATRGEESLLNPPTAASGQDSHESVSPDLGEVVGQPTGRWALEIAAAGGHHLAMIGPPGAGKTMLARRLPSILPDLDEQAALEVTALHSTAGVLPAGAGLLCRPPLQAPHHSVSVPAMIGGGWPARPGAVSLAHRGVLFLDQAPEFQARVLEALRQPLETGVVQLRRGDRQVWFPARVQLLLAANPCPCTHPGGQGCDCSVLVRRRYLGRLSGPLLDRVDIHITVPPIDPATEPDSVGESSATVARRVARARAAAAQRWRETGWSTNAQIPGAVLRSPRWLLPNRVLEPARTRLETGALSHRRFDRAIRVAWTIADLAGRSRPEPADVEQASVLASGQR